jgi:hypothetical protein
MGTINRTYIHNTITKYSYWSCVHLAVNQGPPHDSCWVRSGTTFCRGCLWVQRIPGRLCWSLAPCPSLSRKKLTAGAGFEAWTPENQHEDEGFMFFFHVSVYVHVNTHTYYTYIYSNNTNSDNNTNDDNIYICIYINTSYMYVLQYRHTHTDTWTHLGVEPNRIGDSMGFNKSKFAKMGNFSNQI